MAAWVPKITGQSYSKLSPIEKTVSELDPVEAWFSWHRLASKFWFGCEHPILAGKPLLPKYPLVLFCYVFYLGLGTSDSCSHAQRSASLAEFGYNIELQPIKFCAFSCCLGSRLPWHQSSCLPHLQALPANLGLPFPLPPLSTYNPNTIPCCKGQQGLSSQPLSAIMFPLKDPEQTLQVWLGESFLPGEASKLEVPSPGLSNTLIPTHATRVHLRDTDKLTTPATLDMAGLLRLGCGSTALTPTAYFLLKHPPSSYPLSLCPDGKPVEIQTTVSSPITGYIEALSGQTPHWKIHCKASCSTHPKIGSSRQAPYTIVQCPSLQGLYPIPVQMQDGSRPCSLPPRHPQKELPSAPALDRVYK